MALAQDLPIYRTTFELASVIIDYVQQFPRAFKFNLGDKLVDASLALFEYILLANRSWKNRSARVTYIQEFLLKFEHLKVLIRLCTEKRIISLKQASRLALLTDSIGKQAAGWKKM